MLDMIHVVTSTTTHKGDRMTTAQQIREQITTLEAERELHKGSSKGQITKQIKGLKQQLAAIESDLGATLDPTPPEGEIVTDEQGIPESIASAAEPRPDGTPSEPEAEKPAGPHIVDSEKIDDVRYSIDEDGGVWAPDGDTRCGTLIGHVLRVVDTKMWEGSALPEDADLHEHRSRRQVLIAIVADAQLVAAA